MGGIAYKVGMLVCHPNKPDWGPGKVVGVEAGRIHVVWRDVPGREAKKIDLSVVPLPPASEQSDPVLDNLPPVEKENGTFVLPRERVTFEQARDLFLKHFPQGFEDPAYIGDKTSGERKYKWLAHEYWVERLGGNRFQELLSSDLTELVSEAGRCIGKVNLLHVTETAALRDALRTESAARRFFTTLGGLLEADEVCEDVFRPYAEAIRDLPADRGRVATWPVTTILPFLAQPDRHMFLKPEVTQDAAGALGFHLNYRAEPNWLTYRRLLEMAHIYRGKLAAWKPRDLIDVQSFFYVSCGGYE